MNDPTKLTGPTGVQRVYALNSAQRAEKEKFCEDEENADTVECTTSEVAKITSVVVNEVDRDVDRVRVRISTDKENGRLSLNGDVLPLADFLSCKAPKPSTGRTWTCKGDGNGDTEMIFLAQPSDVNRLLSGEMSVRSEAPSYK